MKTNWTSESTKNLACHQQLSTRSHSQHYDYQNSPYTSYQICRENVSVSLWKIIVTSHLNCQEKSSRDVLAILGGAITKHCQMDSILNENYSIVFSIAACKWPVYLLQSLKFLNVSQKSLNTNDWSKYMIWKKKKWQTLNLLEKFITHNLNISSGTSSDNPPRVADVVYCIVRPVIVHVRLIKLHLLITEVV